MSQKLLMISTDRLIFKADSQVARRMVQYAKLYNELHIIVFSELDSNSKSIPYMIENSFNCFVYPTNSKSKWQYPLDAIRMGQSIIMKNGIDEITCQDPFLTAMAGIALKKRFDIPLELQIHTDIGSQYYPYKFSNRIRKFLAKKYIPRADKVRVVSDKIKNYLVDHLKISTSKIEVRPIIVDTESIKNAFVTLDIHDKYPQFDKIVLMASRLEPEKDITLAIKAWKKVVDKIPKAGLVIVGEGSEKTKIESLIGKLGLKSSIVCGGWADQITLVSNYKTADVFLNTSLFEGYGMTLVEAKFAGCKIISTDVGVAKDIGATIVEHDAHSVAEAVINALV